MSIGKYDSGMPVQLTGVMCRRRPKLSVMVMGAERFPLVEIQAPVLCGPLLRRGPRIKEGKDSERKFVVENNTFSGLRVRK